MQEKKRLSEVKSQLPALSDRVYDEEVILNTRVTHCTSVRQVWASMLEWWPLGGEGQGSGHRTKSDVLLRGIWTAVGRGRRVHEVTADVERE